MGVAQKLKEVKGVQAVKTDVPKRLAVVDYDPKACKPADLLAALKKANFPATVAK